MYKAVLSIRKDLQICFFSYFLTICHYEFSGCGVISSSVDEPKILPNFLESQHGVFSFLCLSHSKNLILINQAGVHI